MVFAMSKSNLVAFRIPSELQDEFNRSVLASGGDKTSWLVDAIRMKLGQPEKSIDSRMLGLVERMEKAAASLIAGKPNIPPKPYNETAVIKIIADTIRQGFDNGRVIAERLNEAGYQKLVKRGIKTFTARGSVRVTILKESIRCFSN